VTTFFIDTLQLRQSLRDARLPHPGASLRYETSEHCAIFIAPSKCTMLTQTLKTHIMLIGPCIIVILEE